MIDEFAYMKHEIRIKNLEDELARYRGKIGNSSFDLISPKVSGAGGVATFDFTSIPAVYSKLFLDLYGRGDTAATSVAVRLTFNGDSSAIYDTVRYSIRHSATLATAEAIATTFADIGSIAAANATANTFDYLHVEIPNYANVSAHKNLYNTGGIKIGQLTGNFYIQAGNGWYRSVNAISRITLTPAAGNFAQYSMARLYGAY